MTVQPRRALQAILALSLFGTAFSGVLTYQELFGVTAMSCPAPGAPGTVFGYPACVYGFFMYVAISVIAASGLRAGRRTPSASPAPVDPAGIPDRPGVEGPIYEPASAAWRVRDRRIR